MYTHSFQDSNSGKNVEIEFGSRHKAAEKFHVREARARIEFPGCRQNM